MYYEAFGHKILETPQNPTLLHYYLIVTPIVFFPQDLYTQSTMPNNVMILQNMKPRVSC